MLAGAVQSHLVLLEGGAFAGQGRFVDRFRFVFPLGSDHAVPVEGRNAVVGGRRQFEVGFTFHPELVGRFDDLLAGAFFDFLIFVDRRVLDRIDLVVFRHDFRTVDYHQGIPFEDVLSLFDQELVDASGEFAGDPDLLVLDEPVNGLDPQGIVEIRELILKLNRERRITVLISSHILDELSRLATHYGIIDHGRMVKELSAEDLDAACRKCIRMEVSDTGILARVLDSMHLEYRITSETMADLFAKPSVTQLAVSLAEEGCEVLSMTEKDESLESYYLSLIGGGSHD